MHGIALKFINKKETKKWQMLLYMFARRNSRVYAEDTCMNLRSHNDTMWNSIEHFFSPFMNLLLHIPLITVHTNVTSKCVYAMNNVTTEENTLHIV